MYNITDIVFINVAIGARPQLTVPVNIKVDYALDRGALWTRGGVKYLAFFVCHH